MRSSGLLLINEVVGLDIMRSRFEIPSVLVFAVVRGKVSFSPATARNTVRCGLYGLAIVSMLVRLKLECYVVLLFRYLGSWLDLAWFGIHEKPKLCL
jgi:hypothetical protein